MKEKLNGKDLINVGIYSAIYFVIVFACAMLGMIPFMYPMLAVIVPIVGGIVFMLFLTKVKKFGMIWIMSVIMGILMLLTGMSWYSLAIGAFSGLAAEFIYKSGNYSSAAKGVLTHGVFSLWVFGNFLLFYLSHDSYMATREEMLGKEFVDTLNKLLPMWSWIILLAVCFICGIIGGFLGRKMLKKHLTKAGIA
ncbi:MAG: MptD family putative ECF transporter S component [Ruminococcus sp.]|nr:MptD family putative ECF transporter S component [Ruminococcus sp.]MCM1381366.1 MptD family putative ECF transporter S component [Muribaculaceae bacterium]MCM1480046.1 MptD family putative ECF transporter S component [Muribaculaceae bacterium]